MGTFWTGFGRALGQYEARNSPIGAALYGGITGKNPFEPSDPNNPVQQKADKSVGRYGRGQAPDDSGRPEQPRQPGDAQNTAPDAPNPTELKPVDSTPMPLDPDAGSAHEGLTFGRQPSSTNINVSLGRGAPGSYGSGGDPGGALGSPSTGGIISGSWWDPPSWGGGNTPGGATDERIDYGGGWIPVQTGTYPGGGGGVDPGTGEENLDGFARGGVAAHNQFAKVAESGPEVAGGRLVTSPMIVSLKKGETVVPLTPSASNKMSPDMLEGHLSSPQPQGMQMSRYHRYGQGKGLMR